MANDGQIVFEVTADGKHAIADIKDITRAIQQETKKWDNAADEATENIGNSFSDMLKKITMGISAAKIGKTLFDFGKQAVNAASDLQEVQNVVDTTFGKTGSAKIDAWAKNAITQFGLTETQAKKFTSTLGAMMKSSGLAGDEIIEMSTDLAGLAADMSSFYNLDFDTAFQKIRSGISGETEPLKQLGINMSVANLNAYALQQGLSKTFEQMSQGEQIMLRYQYLMSATADAQGDFADTSDNFANSVRLLESNMQSLSTNVGEYLVPAMSWIVSSINSLFNNESGEGGTKRRTVLDDIADIDADTQTAIQNIEATKQHVLELTTNLEDIAKKKETVDAAAGSITGAVQGVSSLASELSGITIEDGAKQAFEQTLAVLYNNIDKLSEIKGEEAQGVKDWLDGVAASAKNLKPEDANAWATLMASLIGNVPGLEDTEEGQNLIQQLTQYYLALGQDSAEAAEGLSKLGYGTEDIERLQSDWLSTCKELVRTMPGLSDIIDTQTGEVKGGTTAIKAYADEWARVQKLQAEISGLVQKKELVTGIGTQAEREQNVTEARAKARAYLISYGNLTDEQADAILAGGRRLAEYAYNGENFDSIGRLGYENLDAWRAYQQFFNGDVGGDSGFGGLEKADDALKAYIQTYFEYMEFLDVLPKLEEEYARAIAEKSEEYGKSEEELNGLIDAQIEAEKSMTLVEKAAKGDEEAFTDLSAALLNANDAFSAMADYAESVNKKVVSSVDGVVKGFGRIERAGDSARSKSAELANEEQEVLDKYSDIFATWGSDDAALKRMEANWDNLTKEEQDAHEALVKVRNAQREVNEELQAFTAQGMKNGLEDQLKFMEDYLSNLEKAQAMGLSNELLAYLSDGSAESAEYLAGLVEGGKDAAQEVDATFQKVQAKKKEFSDKLTERQLAVDEVYKALVEDAKKAVAELDMAQGASENTGKTVTAIVTAIEKEVPAVADAVNAILAQVARLSGLSISVDFSSPYYAENHATIGEYETGLNYVPFTGFLASLHEGEGILTAEENRIWQRFKEGGSGAIDYDTMGGVMRDNIKPGGDVFLDGRVVGAVISEQQGRSYRQLQRSGWQG